MGQSSSRPAGSKVYGVDVQVDPKLRAELESTADSDVVRQLWTEKQIEDKVAARLYEERQAAEAAIAGRTSKIAELSDGRIAAAGSDSIALRQRVNELHKELTSRPLRGQLDNEGRVAREKLAECIKDNSDRPLNCRQAFADFQREVTRIEEKTAKLSA